MVGLKCWAWDVGGVIWKDGGCVSKVGLSLFWA
jgi:hypothetical protein